MSDPHNHEVCVAPRHVWSALAPALLFSLAVHAAVGGILLQAWRHTAIEWPQTLTVTLEVTPPVVAQSAPPPAEIRQAAPALQNRARPVPLLPHAPAPDLIAVARIESAPAAVVAPAPAPAPVAEVATAPVVAAKAPAAVNTPSRAQLIEPPNFSVAYLNNPRPAYPPIARKLGLEGRVLLRVEVSAKGIPEKIVVAQTSGAALLDDAAMQAVQGWTFVPARRGETPIAHPVEVPIRFQLNN